jgi:hypothetical protein
VFIRPFFFTLLIFSIGLTVFDGAAHHVTLFPRGVMTTLGRVTPEWDPPYRTSTIQSAQHEKVFDGRAGAEHVWGGLSGGGGGAGGCLAGHGRVVRRAAADYKVALFQDGVFQLAVRCQTGAAPSVSLADLIGLVCRDGSADRNVDLLREVRDMVEHMLELQPQSEAGTLLPMVPMGSLRRVLRMLAALVPAEVEQFRRGGGPRWLWEMLGSDEELVASVTAAERERDLFAAAEAAEDSRYEGTTLSNRSLDEFLVGDPPELASGDGATQARAWRPLNTGGAGQVLCVAPSPSRPTPRLYWVGHGRRGGAGERMDSWWRYPDSHRSCRAVQELPPALHRPRCRLRRARRDAAGGGHAARGAQRRPAPGDGRQPLPASAAPPDSPGSAGLEVRSPLPPATATAPADATADATPTAAPPQLCASWLALPLRRLCGAGWPCGERERLPV